jgi:hypothetical protein
MNAIVFPTASVGFAAGVVASRGRIYQTFDGGYSWTVLPQGLGQLPVATELFALAGCSFNANFVVAGGVNSADGRIIVGS